MRSQFEYAKDNIQQFKKEMAEDSTTTEAKMPFYASFLTSLIKTGFFMVTCYYLIDILWTWEKSENNPGSKT